MLPTELTPTAFQSYPPLAREVAGSRIKLLQRLPLSFLALLLRELIVYDWRFPAERKDLDRQLSFLASLNPQELERLTASFAGLRLTPALERLDWVGEPGIFSEQLTAHLWATHQIEGFRGAAVEFMNRVNAASPEPVEPLKRVGIVVIGQGVQEYSQQLFRKLRPHGVHFTSVNAKDGLGVLLGAVSKRAAASPEPFRHWYIDGGAGHDVSDAGLTCVSYDALRTLRTSIQARIKQAYESSVGSEKLRTLLAQSRPEDFGLRGSGDRALLNHFEVSLFTEGSGTQVFSTTFAQWAAREALRRARPSTLLVRYAPRQKERPMNEMLMEGSQQPVLDPEGSLRDADMGAYYTWINLQRLPSAQPASFLVWFENHSQAVAIGPGFAKGAAVATPIELADLVRKVV